MIHTDGLYPVTIVEMILLFSSATAICVKIERLFCCVTVCYQPDCKLTKHDLSTHCVMFSQYSMTNCSVMFTIIVRGDECEGLLICFTVL